MFSKRIVCMLLGVLFPVCLSLLLWVPALFPRVPSPWRWSICSPLKLSVWLTTPACHHLLQPVKQYGNIFIVLMIYSICVVINCSVSCLSVIIVVTSRLIPRGPLSLEMEHLFTTKTVSLAYHSCLSSFVPPSVELWSYIHGDNAVLYVADTLLCFVEVCYRLILPIFL